MNPFDQFDSPAKTESVNPFDQFDNKSKKPQVGVSEDVAKSAGTGLAKGVISTVGLPADIANLVGRGGDYLRSKGYLPPIPQDSIFAKTLPGSEDIQRGVESVTGPLYKPQTTTGKYAETIGEFIPGAGLASGGKNVLKTVARYGAAPGATSEALGQATEDTFAEPYARAAGALAAPAVISTAKRLITPLPIPQARQALVSTLQSEDVPLTAGQATGSKPLRYLEGHLGDLLGSGGKASELEDLQRRAFTQAALKRAGVSADLATPEAVSYGRQSLSNQFEDLASRNTLTTDRQFTQDLADTVREYTGLVPPSQRAPAVTSYIQDLVNTTQNTGQIPGKTYNSMRSNLSKMSESVRMSDPPTATAFKEIRSALDEAMNRSISPNDATEWAKARKQWGNLKDLEKAASSAGENAAQGYISPAQLRSSAGSGNSRGRYARGEGDFAKLARAGVGVLSPLPNSGTAARISTNAALAAPGAALGAVAAGAPGAAIGAVAAPFVPGLIGRGLLSKPVQKYLSNQKLAKPTHKNKLARALLLGRASQYLPQED